MSATVRLLHHPTSQPCRAVKQLMLETDIPHDEEIVDIINGVNEEPAFKARYNPTGQVPILVDGEFVVWESAAIAAYLAEKFDVAGHWLGSTMQERAIINQYLHWHSTMLRRGAGAFFYTHFAECIWGKRDYSSEIEKGRCLLYESMALVDGWLSRSRHVCGDTISFADLQCYHEFVSHMAGAIIPDDVWRRHPHLARWYDEMSARPHAAAVNEMIVQVGQMRIAGELIPMNRRTSLAKGTEIVGGHTTGIPYAEDTA